MRVQRSYSIDDIRGIVRYYAVVVEGVPSDEINEVAVPPVTNGGLTMGATIYFKDKPLKEKKKPNVQELYDLGRL